VSERQSQRLDFELSNVGSGAETLTATGVAAESDYLLVVLLGSHYCSRSRELVRALAENHESFSERATAVVPVLPDIRERARVWDRRYELPFPMLTDPADDGDDPDAFGTFGRLEDRVEALPAFVLCRCGEAPTVVSTASEPDIDTPLVDSVLEYLDSVRSADGATLSTG